MDRQRGIALLNALVMVAAISAVASGLMLRSENSRDRLGQLQGTDQAALYLDAAEMLFAPVLRADWALNQNLDHLGEGWAQERFNADIDRGQVSAQLRDLQGLFNINWLNNPGDNAALQGFERLLRALDLPVALAREVAGYVQDRGPLDLEAYIGRDVPVRPLQAPLYAIQELRLVRGVTPDIYQRLGPYVTALDKGLALNVNTAPEQVLKAVLPTANAGGIERILAERRRKPFESRSEFTDRARQLIHSKVIDQAYIPGAGLTVSSNWFDARIEARLDGKRLARRVVLERSRLDGTVAIAQRLAERP